MKKKAVFCVLLAGGILMAGCQNKQNAAVTDTTAEADENSEKDTSEVTGRVTEISDTEITLSTGDPGRGDRGGRNEGGGERNRNEESRNQDGNGPNGDEEHRKPAGDSQKTDGNNQKTGGSNQKPDGDDNKPGRDGQRPEGDNRGGDGDVQNQMGESRENESAPEQGNENQGRGDGKTSGESGAELPESRTVTAVLTSATEFINEEGGIISASDIKTGDIVTVEIDPENTAVKVTVTGLSGRMEPGGSGEMGGPGGGHSEPEIYEAATEYSEDTETEGETYSSAGKDENAVHILNGANVSMRDSTVTRTSSDSTGGDSASFYGVGAAILVTDGTADISGAVIDTDSAGGAGIFSYGSGTANVSDSVITTKQDTSGGIHVAGGGTLHAENLTVETYGESSAAIRSDRGSGVMTVKGGSYISNGTGSPAVYSTADITVEDAVLTAGGSEAVCIEGLNSVKLINCILTGNIPENEQNDCNWTVILYQSMSGDSEVGNSTFEMTGGSLTSKNGGLFYTTNTESTFYLKSVDITPSSSNDFFLKCTGNANKRGWGTSGANGADCTFTADSQIMEGDIIWDSISTLACTFGDNSVFTGAFVKDESHAGNGGDGRAELIIDASSAWNVTGDSTLSSLKCSGRIVGADKKTVSIVGTDGTEYVKGDGKYTITVDSYSSSI
ncbi:hypothetical protein [Clostridium transplantifaecale]|uniref:hypothetical protein n=1 Tax=Clostridium transplantifaecale TaxID=2479838 RepID=UPI000F639993|nr:hypothetical protein [Clostridium transplantifaecale]